MPEQWHDINDPGHFFKPKTEQADNTRVAYKTDPVPEPKKEPPPIEVKLSEGKFLPPDFGLKFNDKCKVQVKVEYLRETSLKRIIFSLFCTYNGKTELMKPDKEGFEENGTAEAEFTLFYPEDYRQGDKADFFFKAAHRRGEKVIESERLTLPMDTEEDSNFRIVEILSATDTGTVDKNLRISIKGDKENTKYIYKEENIEIKSSTPLPKNRKVTIQIPQSDAKPVFSLIPDSGGSNKAFNIPLRSFINPENSDPVKIFLFNPASSADRSTSAMRLDGDASYLNGIRFTPITDDDSPMLFVQEMKSRLNIPDGEVIIGNLNGKDCESIVKEILGQDFEDQLDREKVEKGEKETFWTRNEITSSTLAAGHDFYLERYILRDFGSKGKFYIKTTRGKQYVIFKGYKGLRKWYTGTRYKATNPKVVDLTVKGALKAGLKGNGATMLIVGAVDIVDWMFDKDNEKQLSDLCVTLAMDSLKVVVSSIIAAGLTSFALLFVAGLSITAPVWIVVTGTIVIGIGSAFMLDLIDQKIGTSDYMKSKGREGESLLNELWQEDVVEPFGRMYYQLEKTIENLYFIPIGSGH
jgi:hypothetical protein